MSHEQAQFAQLMNRVRDGSDDAVRELLDLYGDYIFRAVRRRLSRQIRSKFDSQDFVQAVWATFFANLPVITHFHRPDSLVAFLARVASNKVIDEYRRHLMTQKRDVNREQTIEGSAVKERKRGPSPSEALIANELLRQLLDGKPPYYRRILELRVKGETQEEIAEQLDLNVRTVRRVVQRILKQLAQGSATSSRQDHFR